MTEYKFSTLDLNNNWGEFIHSNLLKETLEDTAKAIQEVADSISVPVKVDGDMIQQSTDIDNSIFSNSRLTYLPCNIKSSDNSLVYFVSHMFFEGTITKGSLTSDELYTMVHGEFSGFAEDASQVNQRCLIELKYDDKVETYQGIFNLTPSLFRIKSDTAFNIKSDNIKFKIVGML